MLVSDGTIKPPTNSSHAIKQTASQRERELSSPVLADGGRLAHGAGQDGRPHPGAVRAGGEDEPRRGAEVAERPQSRS